jgi:hypothetical protein
MVHRLRHGATRLFVTVALVWPAVQMVLAARYGVTPWRLGGFGMYAVPSPREVKLSVNDQSGREQEVDVRSLPPGAAAVVLAFAERRRLLGRLADPTEVATLLAAMEDRRSLVVTLKTLRFDASRALFEEARERYACEVGPGQAAMSCRLSP